MPRPEHSFSCSECEHFDTRAVDGEPFGTTLEEGVEIPLGVCRTNNGLILGERKATDSCLQPEGTFEPVTTNEEMLNKADILSEEFAT